MTLSAQPLDATSGSPAFTAQQSRQAFSAHIGNGSSRTLGTVSGWSPGRTPSVLTATSTTWTVGAFACIVDPAFTTTQSIYEVANDANLTGSVTAANATNPRKDILYVTVNDTVVDSSGSRNATVSYLAGTAASSPTAPATPARSFLIATISVPTSGGGSPTIALNPVYQVAAGGVLPAATSSALPASATEGKYGDTADTNCLYRYDGSAWVPYRPGPQLLTAFVGSTPTAGTERMYMGSFITTPVAANWSQTISGLGIPAFSTGYTAICVPGDNASSLGQVVVVTSSTLTTLAGQAFTQAGANINAAVRINYIISGA